MKCAPGGLGVEHFGVSAERPRGLGALDLLVADFTIGWTGNTR